MATYVEGEGGYNLICNIPVHSQTKPCTTEILPLFLFHSMQKGEENGRLVVNIPKEICNKAYSKIANSMNCITVLNNTA